MSPRTAIRERVRELLIQAGAWKRSVFVERTVAIDEDDNWPNICIYTPREITIQTTSNQNRKQEISLHIEVRVRHEPDIDARVDIGIDGGELSEKLDEHCLAIEQIILQNFSQADVEFNGNRFYFYPISEINTDIARSAEGAVPHTMALIEFKLNYDNCFEAIAPQTCPLEKFFGAITQVDCKAVPTAESVPVNAVFSNPDLGAC